MSAETTRESVSADSALLNRLRSGEVAAFDALFRRHHARIYRVLCGFVGQEEASDLLQETFLRLLGAPPVAQGTNLSAWLLRVAVNLGRNALRAGSRRRWYRDLLGMQTDGHGWRTGAPDPGRAAEADELRREVRRVLGSLKTRQAAILALRYSGLSYREIAGALGVAPGSVGTLLARAERAFSAAWGRGHPTEGAE